MQISVKLNYDQIEVLKSIEYLNCNLKAADRIVLDDILHYSKNTLLLQKGEYDLLVKVGVLE